MERASKRQPSTKTTYDYFSTPNVVSVTRRDVDVGSGSDQTTLMTLDRLDRVVKVVTPAPGSGITTTTSDQTENGGYVTTFGYDNLGRLLSETDGLDNTTSYAASSAESVGSFWLGKLPELVI